MSQQTVVDQLAQFERFGVYRDLLVPLGAAFLVSVGGWLYGRTDDRRWLALSGCGIGLWCFHVVAMLSGY